MAGVSELFKLVGRVFVDNEDANASLQKTDEKAKGVASSMASGVKTAAKWGAGIFGAATAAGGAMVSLAKSTAADLDVIDKGSQRMGVTAEQYQELAYAAGLSGVEMSTMEAAAKKLEGTDLNMTDAMNQILALEDAEARSAAAAELFGEKVAYSMKPLLNSGAEGFAAMTEEAHQLGLVVDNDTVAAGAAMNDSFSKIQQSIESFTVMLVETLMPTIQQILDWVIENMPEIKATVSGVIEAFQPMFEGLLTFLSGVFSGDWEKIWQGVSDVFGGVFEGLKKLFTDPINFIIGKLNSFIESVNTIQIPDWVPGIGGRGMNLATIPYLAKGGILEKGQTGFLEGNGAEAVVPLSENKAWTSAVARDMSGALGGTETVAILSDILDAVLGLDLDIVLDDGTLVGKLAPKIDRELGRMTLSRKRGII